MLCKMLIVAFSFHDDNRYATCASFIRDGAKYVCKYSDRDDSVICLKMIFDLFPCRIYCSSLISLFKK